MNIPNDIKLVAFDVDGTLIKGNMWQLVHRLAGVTKEEDNKWFSDYFNNKITFFEWVEFINNKYRVCHKKRQDFDRLLSKIEYQSEVADVIKLCQKKYSVCLISSGLDFYVREVARELKVFEWYANYSFSYDYSGEVNEIIFNAPEKESKVIRLRKICKEKNIRPQQIIYVGDSTNDLPAFLFISHGVLVGKGTEELKKHSWIQIGKISELIDILKD